MAYVGRPAIAGLGMTVTIRLFDPIHQEEARSLVLEGLGEHFGVIDPSLNPDLDNIEASFIAAGNHFYVAESDDGHVIRTVGLLFESGSGRIVRMSVARKYRRRGIAKALLERCIEMIPLIVGLLRISIHHH